MRTWSIGTDATRTFRSNRSIHPSRAGAVSTSTSACRQIRPRRRVAAALAAGGRLADDTHVPNWWTLASPENHGVDIAAWPDFEDFEDDEG